MSFTDELLVKPGKPANLGARDPAATPGLPLDTAGKGILRSAADAALAANIAAISELQYKLWAERKRSLLVVLQAMDTGGKDGVIRSVFSGLNPQACRVKSFKAPTPDELDHDFLWRIHNAAPARGEIGVFNRSHYEDVLIVRVRKLVNEPVWRARYRQIRRFERHLVDNDTTIIKLFLHISRSEQLERLKARLADPNKLWKVNPDDFKERKRWDDYMAAYEDALTEGSTKWSPWHVIPADRKWYRNFAVSQIIRETLERMDPKFPPPTFDPKSITLE